MNNLWFGRVQRLLPKYVEYVTFVLRHFDWFGEILDGDEIAVAFSRLSPKQKTLLLAFLESL